MIYEVMITVATFDILPTDDVFPEIFTLLPEEDAFTDKFDRLNYGSTFCIMNMGTMLIIFLGYTVLYFVYFLCKLLSPVSKKAKKISKKLNKMLFWNHAIVFLQEGFLEILIAAVINFVYMSKHQGDSWSN